MNLRHHPIGGNRRLGVRADAVAGGAAGGAGEAEEDVVTWVGLYSTLFILLDDYDLRAGGVR
jgi:hypothetical protein